MVRLLPQRQFGKGTRTKQVRFWVREDEHSQLLARALALRTPMSQLVVDSVLGADARMSSAEARQMIAQLIGVRQEMGECALALRTLDGQDAADLVAELRLLNARLFNATESLGL